MAKTILPPGFRFHPTDVELVKYYLKRKVMGKKFHFEAIAELDIYKFAPWDLKEKSCLRSGDLKWYFFCPRERKYANGTRTKRATESGYWKSTGNDRSVLYNDQVVGMIRSLVFHQGRAPQGVKTEWVMHEYRLDDKDLADAGVIQDAYVLCMIFEKSGKGPRNGAQYGAPFNEEDWNDDVEVNCAEPSPFACLSTPALVLPNNQTNSIVTSIMVPGSGSTCSGSSSQLGPSKTVSSADRVLPPVPDEDDDIVSMLDIPDIGSMLAMFGVDTLPSNENDETEELNNVNHVGNVEAASCLDGNNIYNDLGDLGNLSDLSGDGFNHLSSGHNVEYTIVQMPPGDGLFMELNDLNYPMSPLKFPAEASGSEHFPTDAILVHNDGYNNLERYQDNSLCGLTQSCPLPAMGCYGSDDHLDVIQKENGIGDNANQGYKDASYSTDVTPCKRSELGSKRVSQAQKRGEQRKSNSRLQHLLESIPARPAAAAEHLAPTNGTKTSKGSTLLSPYGGSSIHVKAEVTLWGGGFTKDALSNKLGEFPCECCYGCNLPRREFGKEAATCGSRSTFAFFLGMFSALIWVFIVAVVTKLGRYVWNLVLS